MIGKSTGSSVHTLENASTSKKRILVVDDDDDQLDLDRTLLEMDHYEVFTAQTESEALTILSQIDAPDLILLDMRMEDISGTELLANLEEKIPEIIKKVPVVFLTAMDKVPASKASGFIRKGLDIDDFLKEVRHFIQAGVVDTKFQL